MYSFSYLCNPLDCSLPGSFVHGVFQARRLELVAISYSRGSSWPRDQTQVSCIAGRFSTIWAVSEVKLISRARLFATPWTVAYQAPPSVGFSRQEYWSGLPLPSPGDLPHPGIEPRSLALQADALPSEPPGKLIWAIGKSQILSRVWLFATPWNSPWNSLGQNTGVGRLSLLQGIFLTQRMNPGLPHCRRILSQLSHQGSLKRKEKDRKRKQSR